MKNSAMLLNFFTIFYLLCSGIPSVYIGLNGKNEETRWNQPEQTPEIFLEAQNNLLADFRFFKKVLGIKKKSLSLHPLLEGTPLGNEESKKRSLEDLHIRLMTKQSIQGFCSCKIAEQIGTRSIKQRLKE